VIAVSTRERPRSAPVNLAAQVHERIKAEIFEFRLLPGERFTEGEIAARMNVSRTPVREALFRLQQEGYLEVLFRSGWRVLPLDFAQLDELYDVRIVLELAAVRRLCEQAERPALDELKRIWLVPAAERETDGLTVAQLDERFHVDLVAATGNREMARIHHDVTERIRIVRRLDFTQKPRIEALLAQYKLDIPEHITGLRLNSMACVALPTCGLALAESERYLPSLITELDQVIEECGLRESESVIRMTGCPNGCARPYLGEIGFVGRAPGKYNIYLGAAFDGSRLNKLYKPSVKSEDIVNELAPIIRRYATERQEGERFGDFTIRAGYVKATTEGRLFHEDIMA
jgi:DNA-binding GntR family transcriptional regulator